MAQVVGAFASACAEVNSLRQTRTGNTITVTVLDQDPKGFCIALSKAYRADIPLEGAFPPGDYLVSVNVEKALTINPFRAQ